MQDEESWASAFLVVVGIEKTIMTCYTTGLVLDKNLKNPVSVFRVARCATRKTDTAINRIKTVGVYKTVDTTCKTNTSIIEKTVGDCKIPNGFQ